MGGIALYVETDGQADSPEQAIAQAALSPDTIPFEEGDVVEVKIDATWTTPDGKHHARVSLVKQTKPVLDEKELAQESDNVNAQPVDKKNTAPEVSPVDPDVKNSPDGLTDADPNEDSSALELTPDMEEAEKELEHDFDESRDPNSRRSQDLKDEPAPEEGYNSEGLRRKDEPSPEKKKKKPKPQASA